MALTYRLRLVAALILFACALAAPAQVGQWVYRAHMATPRTNFAASLGKDGKIYVFGGLSGGQFLTSAECYDPLTDTWSPIAPLPSARAGAAAVTAPDGRIFIIAGANSLGAFGSVLTYDPATDGYGTAANFPAFSGDVAAALAKDGQIVALDYYAGPTPGFYVYSLALDSWSPLPAFGNLFPSAGLGSDASGTVYAVGGISQIGVTDNSAYQFDSHTDAWTPIGSVTTKRARPGIAQAADGRIYVAGGNAIMNVFPTVDVYDPSLKQWTTAPDMQSPRGGMALIADARGRIFAIGGENALFPQTSVVDTVESFQPSLLSGAPVQVQAVEGAQFSGDVATITDKDTSQTASNYVASIGWGDGSQSAGSVVSGPTPGTFRVTGAHTYTASGNVQTTVQITDSDGETLMFHGAAKVADADLHGSGSSLSLSVNAPFNGATATFTDDNPGALAGDFTATIEWGDGFVSDGILAANPSGGFAVKGAHTYTSADTFLIKTTVADKGGSVLPMTGTATVVKPAPVVSARTISATEGAFFTTQVATFTDADSSLTAASFSATVQWGDGTSSNGSVSSNGAGGFAVSGSHAYADEGTYIVTVSVTGTGGSPGTGVGLANVADAPITASGFDLTCKGTVFSNTVASFTDADPHGKASEFTAAIYWGDGKSSAGTVQAAGSGFKVVGSHSYLKRSKYTVTITVKDAGGASASAVTHINVGPVK